MNSNDFTRSCKQLRKKYKYECTDEFKNDLQDLFLRAMGQPEELSLELMEYCCPGDYMEDQNFDKMADMIDLFQLDYDETYDRLEPEDWSYLKELVNSWAMDMNMEVVTYIMQLVVAAGEFR
jgi:hypothetical protein